MRYSYHSASKAFRDDKISELANHNDGLRFLILRSLSRSEYMIEVAQSAGLDVESIPKRKLLQVIFENSKIDLKHIRNQINIIYERERLSRKNEEQRLLNELYRLQYFDWGGLHQNSLEKNIVDNYVKKIKKYDSLCEDIDTKLYPSMRSYVLCSWYNHWTSIIIEDIFKDHKRVLPAIGLIKKVDFFIDDIPFDLKVTYLPEGYIKKKRKDMKYDRELTILKKVSRDFGICIPDDLPESKLLEDLWNKIQDHPSRKARTVIKELRQFRRKIVMDILDNSSDLIRWLYENQGVRRFDSSNRIYLVLINMSNYFESWKLKRARDFLVKSIHGELDVFSCNSADRIQFDWEGESYHATSKAVIVVKRR